MPKVKNDYLCFTVRRATAVILLVLFSLGAFGVSIEQHLCCHSQQEESATKHCSDDESCCNKNDDCCDKIVSQVKISKDYHSQQSKISFELSACLIPSLKKYYTSFALRLGDKKNRFGQFKYLPPPKDFQSCYSSFLI